jgi:hypothetical protein
MLWKSWGSRGLCIEPVSGSLVPDKVLTMCPEQGVNHVIGMHLTGANPNDVCAQCHLPTKFAVTEHAGHAPEQAGCVDCHMTSRTYMVVDDRRDHSFRIPRPDLTAAIGTPNACTNCHVENDAAWAAAAITDWRGTDGAPPRPHYATALNAGRQGFANAQLREASAMTWRRGRTL